jgi:arginyl-tRNA synthetase
LAWVKWGNGETPESAGMKGDHFVGKYYVMFDKKHKEEINELVHRGYTEDDAYTHAQLMKEAKTFLVRWENADEEILSIWRTMNNWTYEGFDETYHRLGIEFDKVNYESEIYLAGRDLVLEGLERDVFYQNADGSVCVDLTDEGLDEKLLLRSDGTSLYITQDIGTAYNRYEEYNPNRMVYVVGNEQIYHFEVLKKVLKKLGNSWHDKIFHLSYGMVELPHGRMKSREGTVVDADDLMDEMLDTARKTTEELGKTDDFNDRERSELFRIIGMGALKYYILKVDPKKNMLFNPEESIDFNGNTGPFIQYTYARIQSLLKKAEDKPESFANKIEYDKIGLLDAEKELIGQLYDFPDAVKQAGETLNPAILANHVYELAKTYNHYYQDNPIVKRVDESTSRFRISLSWFTGRVILSAMWLLGIEVPEKM